MAVVYQSVNHSKGHLLIIKYIYPFTEFKVCCNYYALFFIRVSEFLLWAKFSFILSNFLVLFWTLFIHYNICSQKMQKSLFRPFSFYMISSSLIPYQTAGFTIPNLLKSNAIIVPSASCIFALCQFSENIAATG